MPKKRESGKKKTRSKRVSQQDVPRFPLGEATRIAEAIFNHYGGDPTPPLHVAKALDLAPNSGHFRNLCGSAIGFGLTEGGPKASEIALTPLALRILRPLAEGDDLAAKRDALLTPTVIGKFLQKYDGSPLPRTDIAQNVLEQLGVPRSRTKEILAMITEGAASVGLLAEIKDKTYVDLSGVQASPEPMPESADPSTEALEAAEDDEKESAPLTAPAPVAGAASPAAGIKKRVFVTHGKDTSLLSNIKKLLAFGELEPVIAAERQSVAKPVPDKVLDSMRSCGAAIIHVDAEKKLLDQDATEHVVLNPNVLIEIGAAMALYGRRFILLVREGVELPSNLQGLYEVRYSGSSLDGDATIKLLEAIGEMKKVPLPSE